MHDFADLQGVITSPRCSWSPINVQRAEVDETKILRMTNTAGKMKVSEGLCGNNNIQ